MGFFPNMTSASKPNFPLQKVLLRKRPLCTPYRIGSGGIL